VEDTLWARYLDYLLHHPNELITAFELEILVTPEKGEARSTESIQPESDPRAKRDYRKALGPLQAQRRCAKQAGDQARGRDLDLDIEKINAALNKRGGMADTGERALLACSGALWPSVCSSAWSAYPQAENGQYGPA